MKEGQDKPVIVIPTNRPEQFNLWLDAWQEQLEGCHLIVIEDNPKYNIKIPKINNISIEHYSWKDIDKDLGKDAWIIPRETDCVRSYGFLKALEHKPLFIITLDDDTLPYNKTIQDHYKALFSKIKYLEHSNNYYNTMKTMLPRGYFNDSRNNSNKVVLSHGAWIGVPDLNAHTQITDYKNSGINDFNVGIIPRGSYFSMCGMNIAFKPEITKYLYFGLQGKDYPIDRCGDTWAGYYLSQKLNEDKSNINQDYVVTGLATVKHLRASNTWNNLKKEKNADHLGFIFRKLFCEKDSRTDIDEVDESWYFKKLKEAYKVWERLCNERYNHNS